MFIGEINQVYFPENCLNKEGFLDIKKPIAILVSDYFE